MTLDKLWNMIQNNENFPVIVKGKTQGYISFSAFGEENSNCTLRLYLNENGLLTIASYNPNAERHQLQRCRKETIGMSDEEILKEAEELLLKARDAFDQDRYNGSRCSDAALEVAKKNELPQSSSKITRTERDAIEKILKNGIPSGKFWMNECINPWLKPTYHEKGTFILEDDWKIDKVKNFIWHPGGTDTQIRANVLPQPYIGDPNAPIWLLLMNPSYSEADIYDMVRCDDDIKQKVIASIKSGGKRVYKTDKEVNELKPYFFMENSESQLDARKNLMRQQLSFTSTKFYVLEPEFHTVRAVDKIAKKQNKVARRDSSCQGSYEWWNTYLLQQDICKGEPANLKNFFVLESFPYHSEKYDETLRPKVEHFKFWVKMVVYALLNKKILLCRESIGTLVAKVAKQLQLARENENFDIENAMKNQIFVSTSSGSFSVSTGNFYSYNTMKQIEKIKKEGKGDFKKIITGSK